MASFSQRFLLALRLDARPQYVIANQAGWQPTTFGKLVCGITRVDPDDPRVAKLADLTGVPYEAILDDGSRHAVALLDLDLDSEKLAVIRVLTKTGDEAEVADQMLARALLKARTPNASDSQV